MNTESSLTSPQDRDHTKRLKFDTSAQALTDEETEAAVAALTENSFIENFPRVERAYADPPIPLQKYFLFSFIPARNAKPDDQGVFGYAKVRGSYETDHEAASREDYLIKNHDSYHVIQTGFVGRPFPVTLDPKYSAKTKEIDVRKKMAQDITQDLKSNKHEEEKEVREILDRQQKLLEESRKGEIDSYDAYITQQVKKANLVWRYIDLGTKLVEMRDLITKAREVLAEMNTEHPEYIESYREKYFKAREEAGIKPSPSDSQNFLKFMIEDVTLDFEREDWIAPVEHIYKGEGEKPDIGVEESKNGGVEETKEEPAKEKSD